MNAAANVRTLTVRRQVAASPSDLFDAWLDPEKLADWMRPASDAPSKVEVDPRVGGELEVDIQTSSGKVPHTGDFRVIDRPNRLVFTWNSPSAGKRDSVVTIDFKPIDRGTEVVLSHANLPDEDQVEGHTHGWTRVLELMSASYSRAH